MLGVAQSVTYKNALEGDTEDRCAPFLSPETVLNLG